MLTKNNTDKKSYGRAWRRVQESDTHQNQGSETTRERSQFILHRSTQVYGVVTPLPQPETDASIPSVIDLHKFMELTPLSQSETDASIPSVVDLHKFMEL
ncbi:hypothetical protein RRG08_017146 [Elysia crispata]|uniref:Uncharacterized protein n=1 Tax=Elysia crispata TaxID=231223 RepID=A0AAE0ZAS1_9GAST|nr:hypothetical protein RRG08_017146 [Elysia crispata]